MSEKDLISARVGLLEITEEQIEKMTVRPENMKTIGIPPCTGTPKQPQICFPKKKD